MPPKKDATPKVFFGKPGNNVKIGLVGLPNVGKSSLFNLLGGLQVPAENYPFCTIDPANTQVAVPDFRFRKLCEVFKPKKEIAAVLTVTDIAGLVKGAAEGKGLGNAFLSHIQAVDAIYHVTRAFIKKDVEHVEGTVDPCRDFEIIRAELVKKDLEWMKGHTDGTKKKGRAKMTKELEDEIKVCDACVDLLEKGKEIRHGTWTTKDVVTINTFQLLTIKPCVYIVNISKDNAEKGANKWFMDIKKWVAENSPGDPVIPFSAAFEEHLLTLKNDEEAKKKYLEECKTPGSQMPKIIKSGYAALNLQNYFTVGEDEVRSWSIRTGTLAPGAAGVIHGDFEKHFVKAEIYNYTDFEALGSENEVKAKGKIRTCGKDYEMVDGDIMFVKHAAGGAGKK